MMKNLGLKLSVLTLAVSLAGCGGGGSDGYFEAENNSNGGGTGSGIIEGIKLSNFSLKNSNGEETETISALGATATIKVTDSSGKPISGALVNFSGENMTFSTTNSSVFTNAEGEASIGIVPTDSTVTGAYTISVSVTHNEKNATQSKNVSFVKTDITLSKFLAANTALVSGGSTLITLLTQDVDGQYQNDQTVTFSASCGSFSNPSVISSSEGNVSNTYYGYDAVGNLCSGNQTITATPSSSTANAKTISLNIQAATASSVVYTTANPVQIAVRGSGSSSSGQVEFTVYSNGAVLSNQDITLSLTKSPVGASFVSLGNTAEKTVKSDSNGKVIVNLYPGDIPGPIEVKAALPNGFSALSKNVTLTTGRATQNSFSLSMSKNSLQNAIDGDEADIVARLTDRNGNSVPDGTVVNFVTEAGRIDGACSTSAGACSVKISTQNPRQADGRVTVLAYVEGDKSFIDKDGDNIYTVGKDTFTNNIGSFFRDDNENGQYDNSMGEFLYTRLMGKNPAVCGPGSFTEPNIKGTCDDELPAILRRQVIIYFASSTATVPDLAVKGNVLSFNAYGNSALTTPMPSGTTVQVTANDNTKENDLSCTAEFSEGGNPVADIVSSTYYAYRLKECAKGDDFTVKITAPNGKISNFYVSY